MLFANQSQHFYLKQSPKIFKNTLPDQQAGFELVVTLDSIDLHLSFENLKQINAILRCYCLCIRFDALIYVTLPE